MFTLEKITLYICFTIQFKLNVRIETEIKVNEYVVKLSKNN